MSHNLNLTSRSDAGLNLKGLCDKTIIDVCWEGFALYQADQIYIETT